MNNQKLSLYKQKISHNKPLKVIAHRGLCNIFPENTIEAVQAGLYVADLVQIDIMLTKDKQAIVFHDLSLSRLTNISQIQQWSNRKRQADNNGKIQSNWWVEDFTLEELRKLQIRQPNQLRPKLKGQKFYIPTFQELLERCLEVKSNPKHVLKDAGLLVQMKGAHKTKQQQSDKYIAEEFIKILKKLSLETQEKRKKKNLPIIAQSFQLDALYYLQKQIQNQVFQIPLIILIRKTQSSKTPLKDVKHISLKNQIGFGISQHHVNKQTSSFIEGIIQSCHQRNMQIFYWTIIDDKFIGEQTQQKFPFRLKKYSDIYHHLKKIGVTGFITQFPQKCRTLINLQLQYQLQQQESQLTDASK